MFIGLKWRDQQFSEDVKGGAQTVEHTYTHTDIGLIDSTSFRGRLGENVTLFLNLLLGVY